VDAHRLAGVDGDTLVGEYQRRRRRLDVIAVCAGDLEQPHQAVGELHRLLEALGEVRLEAHAIPVAFLPRAFTTRSRSA